MIIVYKNKRPKIIEIGTSDEFEKLLRPWAYSPDRTKLFILGPVRCLCKSCGTWQLESRFDFEMNRGLICEVCGAFTAGYFIPDNALVFRMGPVVRQLHLN
jgi:hypothetical protein